MFAENNQHRPLRAFVLAVAGATFLAPATAHASGVLELSGAPSGTNALTARVQPWGSAATYYDPALLPYAVAGTDIGGFVLVTHGTIELQNRPSGVDVPASIYNARLGSTRLQLRPLPTAALPATRGDTHLDDVTPYAVLGVVRPIVPRALVFGFYGVLPIRSLQKQDVFFSDEREQYFSNRLHFELYGDRTELAAFAVALGSELADWLSVGAGVDVTIGTVANTDVYVPDAGDQRTILLAPHVEAQSEFSPYLGVSTLPTPRLRLAATVHFPASSDTEGENHLRFWNYTYPAGQSFVRQNYELRLGYEPLRVGFGGVLSGPPLTANRTENKPWQLGVQAMLARYATYVDRHGERPLDAFSDTWTVAVGGSLPTGSSRVSADLAYIPSPVPDQTGRTNYVDNARIAAALGLSVPFEIFRRRFELAVSAQAQLLVPRSVTKSDRAAHPVLDEFPDGATDVQTDAPMPEARGLQTNNPGYPGFESGGYIVGGGLSLRVPD